MRSSLATCMECTSLRAKEKNCACIIIVMKSCSSSSSSSSVHAIKIWPSFDNYLSLFHCFPVFVYDTRWYPSLRIVGRLWRNGLVRKVPQTGYNSGINQSVEDEPYTSLPRPHHPYLTFASTHSPPWTSRSGKKVMV